MDKPLWVELADANDVVISVTEKSPCDT